MSLMIFFPGSLQRRRDASVLDEAGLGALIDRTQLRAADRSLYSQLFTDVTVADVLDNGPDGGQGILFGLNTTFLHCDATQQVWFEGPRTGDKPAAYWIGWRGDNPPTPDNCARKNIIAGEPLVLADGHTWQIPCALDLPRSIGFDSQGNVVTKDVVPQYRAYAEAAEEMLGKFMEARAAGGGVDVESAMAFATLALQQNYRVTREVILARELFDSVSLWRVCDLANGVTRTATAGLRRLEAEGIDINTPADSAA